jgi:hypothetical protein
MQPLDSPHYLDPLDLLRRFIPTPLKAFYDIGTVRVTLETNDIALLPTRPLPTCLHVPGQQRLQWRLVRDWDWPGPLEAPIFLTSGALMIVAMGPACLLGVDHQKRELLGFIGAAIDQRTHQEVVIPLLCRLSKEMLSRDASSDFGAHGARLQRND